MSKKKSSPRAPFVVTVALSGATALVSLPACQGNIISNPPIPDTGTCPESAPTSGTACSSDTLDCSYDGPCGDRFLCSAGSWVAGTPEGICNPPAPVCPMTQPPGGEACADEGEVCNYEEDVGCGPEPVVATCTMGAWSLMFGGGTCNPPIPEPCSQYATEESCGADVACRWLVPGCGMPPLLPAAGCHAIEPCTLGAGCISGDTCQTVDVDPCWNKDCNACSAQTEVCLPPVGI